MQIDEAILHQSRYVVGHYMRDEIFTSTGTGNCTRSIIGICSAANQW
jgi:hypothetical protein